MYPHPPPTKGSIKNSTSGGIKKAKGTKKGTAGKRAYPVPSAGKAAVGPSGSKKVKKTMPKQTPGTKKKKSPSTPPTGDPVDRQKAAAAIQAVNAASGGKNDRAAALAAAILRGVTMQPSGKWVSCLSICFDGLVDQ